MSLYINAKSTQMLNELAEDFGVEPHVVGLYPDDHAKTVQEASFKGFVASLLSNNIEEEVAELKADIKDIKTPEQRKLLLLKCIKLLQKAVIMRHNWSPAKRYIQGLVDKTKKHAKGNPIQVANANLNAAIGQLTMLRDKILDMKVRGTEDYEENLKAKVDQLQKAAGLERLSDSDF